MTATMENGGAWVAGATMFCEWMEEHSVRLGKPRQEAVLFVDRPPLEAQEIFRSHGVRSDRIAFLSRLTTILPPVDVSCLRAFKADFVKLFGHWATPNRNSISPSCCIPRADSLR